MARNWGLTREIPKTDYPLQRLNDALASLSERTCGVVEARRIAEQVAKKTEGGLLVPTKNLLDECEKESARMGLTKGQQQSGLKKINDAIKMMYRI